MQITEHIHALKIPFQITIAPAIVVDRFVYVYLIVGSGNIGLIDTGVSGSQKIIFDYIESIGRSPKQISNIILTHAHPDHIGSAKAIKEASRCLVSIHAAEKPWIENVELQFKERPVPGFHSLVQGSVRVDRALEDGDVIDLSDNLALETIHTPGHSQGSASFFLKQDNALFCGDAILLPGQMPIFDDLQSCITSVNKLKKTSGAETLLSAWYVPQKEEQIVKLMDDSVNYLTKINEAVKIVAARKASLAPAEFCKNVLNKLELPETMMNPLIIRSFQSILNRL